MFARLSPVFRSEGLDSGEYIVRVQFMLGWVLKGRRNHFLSQAIDANDLDEQRWWTQYIWEDQTVHLLYFLDMLFERLGDVDLVGTWTKAIGKGYDAMQCQEKLLQCSICTHIKKMTSADVRYGAVRKISPTPPRMSISCLMPCAWDLQSPELAFCT